MSREKLKKEAEEWLNKWELCNKCENKVNCISNFSYCKKVVLQSYLASAEPREKQIQIDAKQIRVLQKQNGELNDKIKELEAQIENYKLSENEAKEIIAELKEVINNDVDKKIYVQLAKKAELADIQRDQLNKAKEIMNIAIEGIKHWGIVGGYERPFEKQAEKLFNLFLDKAEQFINEVEK